MADDSQLDDAPDSSTEAANSKAALPESDRDLNGEKDKNESAAGKLEKNGTDKPSGIEKEAAKPSDEAVSKQEDVVKVRKLRLQADGTVTDKSGLAESETESLKAEEEAKKESA